MSNAVGAVRFEGDGAIFYFEYVGSSDVADARLRLTEDEVHEHWRARDDGDDRRCHCPDESAHDDIELVALYGDGLYWEGRACRRCLVITVGFMPYEGDDVCVGDGQPAWSPWLAPVIEAPEQGEGGHVH